MGSFLRVRACLHRPIPTCRSRPAIWALFDLDGTYTRYVHVYSLLRILHLCEPTHLQELPWFGEMPGYYNTSSRVPNANMYYPPPSAGGYGYPYQGGYPMPQQGNSIVIQPNPNGGPPTITQMPLSTMP